MKVPFWKLALAYLIDWFAFSFVSAVINFPVGILLGTAMPDPNAAAVVVMFFSVVSSLLIFVLYFALLEYFFHASLGKMAMKIVVTPKN